MSGCYHGPETCNKCAVLIQPKPLSPPPDWESVAQQLAEALNECLDDLKHSRVSHGQIYQVSGKAHAALSAFNTAKGE